MIPELHIKDPDETLDYVLDWNGGQKPFLGEDTIITSTWIVPAGITNVLATNDATTTTIWLSGGTLGETYLLTNRIASAGSRVADYSFNVLIKQK